MVVMARVAFFGSERQFSFPFLLHAALYILADTCSMPPHTIRNGTYGDWNSEHSCREGAVLFLIVLLLLRELRKAMVQLVGLFRSVPPGMVVVAKLVAVV